MKADFQLIHRFVMGDTHIVLDINSGIVHEVSQTVWDFLAAWEAAGDLETAKRRLIRHYPLAEVEDVRRALEKLAKEGMLFSRDPALEQFKVEKTSFVKALCLHIAHDCNMRCGYCFAGTGSFGGSRTLMEAETGRRALEFLFAASGPRVHVEVDYFGGEPLLNFEVVQELVHYGKKRAAELGKILTQTLTTNGLLLTSEVIEFLNQEGVLMVMSLDGRPEVHDRMRPLTQGKKSYTEIMPHLKALVASRKGLNYYLRGTYTHYNLDFAEDVLHMVDSGFREVSVEPVVAEPQMPYALLEEDVPFLEAEYEKLAQAWLAYRAKGRPFNFFHFNINLDKGPCLPKRISGCGAGHEYLAVSPEGDLYPCHQFVGKEEFKIGDVQTGMINHLIGRGFKENHVLNKEACRSCWARFHCSGGCHANAYNHHQDISIPYEMGCRLEKKRLECAIYLQVKSASGDETGKAV